MMSSYGTARTRNRRWTIFIVAMSLAAAQAILATSAGAATDVQVNNSGTDTGNSTTQSETTLAYGNGVLCAGFNDFGPPAGLSGFASSTNMGATWTDQGGLNERGDPVIAYHAASDTFYYASLGNAQIRVAASTDGCQTFGAAVNASTFFARTTLADKPWIAVDNTGGATDGNLYICWTRFVDTSNPPNGNANTSELRVARSTDGGTTWTNEQVVAPQGRAPFGCSIAVASDGSVGVVWADRNDNDIDFRRSTDAGVTWGGTQQVNSAGLRHPGIDNVVACGGGNRPTLNGNIRMLHQAWMTIDTTGGPNDGNIYVTWASDPVGGTDQSDVFFSVSTNNGANWANQLQLGAGGGQTDQFEPHVAVADNGDVGVVWYDRRNDAANNLNIDVYTAFSSDGGSTFGALTRVTDQSFGVPPLNPNFNPGTAQCYMGEYIAVAGQGGGFYYLWGDNRNTVTNTAFPTGRLDPDVFFDFFPGPSNQAPMAAVDPASGDEGAAIGLNGTATDADGDFLIYSWSYAPVAGVDAGATCAFTDDATLNPTVTCSDDGTYTVTLTVTGDPAGAVTASNTLTVTNVAPDVTATSSDVTLDEGESYTMTAGFTDPGWNDTYTGSIDWDFPGEAPEAIAPVVTNPGPPEDQGTISGTRQYGDNGTFTVVAQVSDDDGGSGSDSRTVTVNNVAPTAEIDETATILINGVPTFLANAGDPVDFSGRSTDPGSDDLTLRWDWDDGPPSPDVVDVRLVNPPAADPLPSPSVQPRDETSDETHAFGDACRYDIVFDSTDDDGGTASDTAVVIIVGNDHRIRTAGYWTHQYRGNGNVAFSDFELECFLDIVDFVSQVFSEERNLSNFDDAVDVLRVNGTSDMAELLDRQLLAALLNFTNGSVGWAELVDTDGDTIGDTAFSDVVAAAEAVRLNAASTRDMLETQKDLLERINVGLAT
jgi:hypothetical protein